ncbi:MAG TPA: sensor domain-containing protein [Streptosporangiales bacterium]
MAAPWADAADPEWWRRQLPTLLRAPIRAQTWIRTAHVLSGVVLGLVYFAVVVPLVLIALVTTPVLFVGMPMLWLTLAVARAFAHVERARLRRFTGVDVEPSPREEGVLRSPFTLLRSRNRWREIAYCAVRLPISLLGGLLVLGSWVLGIGLIVAFVIGPFRGTQDFTGFVEWLLSAVAGGALVITVPWLARAAVYVDVTLVRMLLGPSESERLAAEVSTLRTTRAEVVDAADAERRRIERDLHDGAQQRLVALAMDLGVARASFERDPDNARRLVVKAHEEAKSALADLRELVRGIHPAVLTDRGLDAALSALAARCPVPVEVRVAPGERAEVAIEAAAYFVVAEALTNVARHARAGRVLVDVARDGDRLGVVVEDDGVGGADAGGGTGLAGLERRVAALDGTFTVVSPAGGPTRIEAVFPCA